MEASFLNILREVFHTEVSEQDGGESKDNKPCHFDFTPTFGFFKVEVRSKGEP